MKLLVPLGLLILATSLEAGGDAIIRVGLKSHTLSIRAGSMIAGSITLFFYGLTLNLAPLDWGRLIGAYVAIFFVVAQVINLLAFKTVPTVPILVGGAFIVAGGLVITLWRG